MTRFPREPLDAEERALAARLPRPHGRDEPGSALDARILAAAHAAAQTPLPPSRRSGRWTLPLGLAASLCLALGLAWRMQVAPPQQDAATHASEAAAAAKQASPTAVPGASTPTADEAAPLPAVAMEKPAPTEAPIPKAATPAKRLRIAPTDPEESRAMAPAAFPAPPAPPAPAMASRPAPPALPATLPAPPDTAAPVAAQAIRSEGNPPAAARAMARPSAAGARRIESAKAADALQADAPDEDIPPATAAAPEVREAWLRRIGELMRQGKTDEARASLMEFRRRYPEAELPAELRPLEPAVPEPASH